MGEIGIPLGEERKASYEKMMELVRELIHTHGEELFQSNMVGFSSRLHRLSHLNTLLSELTGGAGAAPADAGKEDYNALVAQIVEATQDYYTYLGTLPEDFRSCLLHMVDLSGGMGESMDELEDLAGISLPEANPLLSIQSIRPRRYIMQLDAVTNQLANLGEERRLQVGRRGRQPVLTTVTLEMPDHMKIQGGNPLTIYDKSIINGVTSLLESGNTVFSIPMLYHAMTGKQNPTVDDQLYEELTGKLEKMRRMILSVDLREESEAHYITGENGEQLRFEDLVLEGYLLPLNKVTGYINGKRAELYQIIQRPPLYTYAKMRRQMASIPIFLLDAPVNNNSTTIPLRTYLMHRLELMRNPNNNMDSDTILYQSVYEELGAGEANKTRKKRIRNYTCVILGYLMEQGYITGYSEFKKGRTIAGVRVRIHRKEGEGSGQEVS